MLCVLVRAGARVRVWERGRGEEVRGRRGRVVACPEQRVSDRCSWHHQWQ